MFRRDPGPCPICGEAHTACIPAGASRGGSVVVPVLTAGLEQRIAQPLEADRIQATLPPGQFTSATYERAKHGPAPPKRR